MSVNIQCMDPMIPWDMMAPILDGHSNYLLENFHEIRNDGIHCHAHTDEQGTIGVA